MATKASLAIGDHVRLKSRAVNQHASFRVTGNHLTPTLEPVDGLILAIRDIASGKLVPEAKGSLDHYVIELLYDRTFNAKYASARNSPRGTERPSAAPAFRRMHDALHQAATNGEFFTSTQPEQLAQSPLGKLLDGWKIIKVRSTDLESLEQAQEGEDTPAE